MVPPPRPRPHSAFPPVSRCHRDPSGDLPYCMWLTVTGWLRLCGMMGGVEYITGAAGVMYLLLAAILIAIMAKAFLPGRRKP